MLIVQPICLIVLYDVLVKNRFCHFQGRKCEGCEGVVHPQTYVSVGLQMSAVGLKI